MEKQNDMIISLPLLFVPFLNRDDGTRLQMALSQMRQGLPLYYGEKPLVETGYEPYFYKYFDGTVQSIYNGTIVYINKRFIIIRNDDKPPFIDTDLEFIELPYLSQVLVKKGDRVTKGQIIAFLNSPAKRMKHILDGMNLLTLIKMHKGKNYEDAVIISKSASKKLTHYEIIKKTIHISENQIALSLEEDTYKPFLRKGDIVTPDKPIARIKNSNLRGLEIFKEEKKEFIQNQGIIVDVKYFVNKQNVVYREFQKYITDHEHNNLKHYQDIISKIKESYFEITGEELKKIPEYIDNAIQFYSGALKRRAYKSKNNIVDLTVEYTIMSLAPTRKGDKFANRHGNKGVNSNDFIIEDDEFMPRTKDGRTIDIIINIMGIPSRMNAGQLFELAASNIIWKLKNDLLKDLQSGTSISEIKSKIKEFYSLIDYTEDRWIEKTYYEILDSIQNEKELQVFISNMSFLAPTFESIDIDSLIELKKKYNVNELTDIYNPVTQKWEKGTVGYMYWLKLYHLAREKLAARSIGEYIQKTGQPTSGRKNKGGQRVGEMEIWNFISHELSDALKEMLYTKSDDLVSKEEVLNDIIETGSAHLPTKTFSKISEIAKKYLNAVNLSIVESNEENKEGQR